MINDELLSYITAQKMRGVSREVIKSKLLSSGWVEADTEEGLSKVFTTVNATPALSTPSSIYNANINTNIGESTSVQTPKVDDKYREPVEKEEKPIQKTTAFQIPQRQEFIPTLMPKAQFIPPARPLTKNDTIVQPNLNQNDSSFQSFRPKQPPEPTALILNPENYSPNPKMAVTSSYQKDLSVARATSTNIGGYKWLRWVLGTIVIVGILGGLAFAYTKGYIKLPFDLPLMKKDPKQVLVLVPESQSKVKTFKFEGDITFKFPSVYSVIGMMMSGENAKTSDTDNFTIHNSGTFSRGENNMPLFNMNFVINSSLLDNKIESELHTKEGIMYILFPDLSSTVPSLPIQPGWVSVNANDLDPIINMLPNNVNKFQMRMQKEFLLNSNKDATWQSVMKILTDTLAKAQIVDKGDEVIYGKDVSHYALSIDSMTVKSTILDVIKTTPDLVSSDNVDQLSGVLNTLTLNTIEVWVGKADNLIYKYSIDASLPLSKILSINDKNLSESMANINITETYYDYGSVVTPNIPDQASSVLQSLEFARNESIDSQTRVAMQVDFANAARDLKKIEGVYGYKSNTKGDCTNPSMGSLFSPLGHKASSVNTVGSISQQILLILNNTDGRGTCYSTPSAWAVAVPLRNNPTSLFCVDSTGKASDLPTPIKGPVCK
jgi:hypothetical protein